MIVPGAYNMYMYMCTCTCVHVPFLQEGTTSIATQTEPPPRGVSDLWGLDEEIDKWQVSAMPEEKQYFSMDVSWGGRVGE